MSHRFEVEIEELKVKLFKGKDLNFIDT